MFSNCSRYIMQRRNGERNSTWARTARTRRRGSCTMMGTTTTTTTTSSNRARSSSTGTRSLHLSGRARLDRSVFFLFLLSALYFFSSVNLAYHFPKCRFYTTIINTIIYQTTIWTLSLIVFNSALYYSNNILRSLHLSLFVFYLFSPWVNNVRSHR